MTDLAALAAEEPRVHQFGMTSILAEFQAKGEAVGEARGQVKMLLRLLERRFDELSDWAAAKVSGRSADDLQTWADRVLEVATLEDIFADD